MAERKPESRHMGRANGAFVFGQGDEARAVISKVVVQTSGGAEGERVRFRGPGAFVHKTADHIQEMILPAVDHVFSALNVPLNSFEISVANLGAASVMDTGLSITGFSSDVPVFLAMLSAGLQMALPEDMVSTGHIASSAGDIRLVQGIGAKLEAALRERSIRTFVYPSLECETSMEVLTPRERQRAEDAVTRFKTEIRTVAVRDVGELLREAFSDEAIVRASLLCGFYGPPSINLDGDAPIEAAAAFLARDNEKRFWRALERNLLSGRKDEASRLLTELAGFHIRRRSYPHAFGSRLLQTVLSLPPGTRLKMSDGAIMEMGECIQISQFAEKGDHEDVGLLFKAVSVETWKRSGGFYPDGSTEPASQDKGDKVAEVLTKLSDTHLAALIDIPVDTARGTYILESVVARSAEDFWETITSFYIHLKRHAHEAVGSIHMDTAKSKAVTLVEEAFSGRGGEKAAMSEARWPTNGGLRLVLDMMTDQYKREARDEYVKMILKQAIDPLNWNDKVALTKAILDAIKHDLSPELAQEPPETYAKHYEALLRAYVQSMDKVKAFFRSF